MNAKRSTWIRQFHRWTAIAFIGTVIATFVALAQDEPVVWVSYLPLIPLALLSLTGMNMLAAPYTGRWRRRKATVAG
jgi:hypothetical protein